MSRIELKEISAGYRPVPVLQGISLTVRDGEMLTLLGPSGCGKTTALKVIAGLLSADKGQVLADGEDITEKAPEERGTVLMFQDHLLFPHLTVVENIGFGLRMKGRSKGEIKSQTARLMELLKLKGLEKRDPRELSGGQRQRVALARALAVSPRVILLDEPFSNLDTQLRETVRQETLQLLKDLQITTILVTHDTGEALGWSDRVAVLLNGKIAQIAAPEELYQRPASLAVADLLGGGSRVEGRIRSGVFYSGALRLLTEGQSDGPATALIRPGDITVDEEGDLSGEITARSFAGETNRYEADIFGHILKFVHPSPLMVGEKVRFQVIPGRILYYKGGNECSTRTLENTPIH